MYLRWKRRVQTVMAIATVAVIAVVALGAEVVIIRHQDRARQERTQQEAQILTLLHQEQARGRENQQILKDLSTATCFETAIINHTPAFCPKP